MHDAHDWWRVENNPEGPSAVVARDGSRRIRVPLRGKAKSSYDIDWSYYVAKGLASQLNGPSWLPGGHVWNPKELA